ncbi:outer membrane beta-barrel protein [Hymenobacter terricola]|uniref:outer membrane beta-barrel protein n=1 Tax=Hymenobacter terricola TaxID=2819236 RepID=UPI001B30063E|nr:outer membrane beta-barrel protein [Hymenobacter terricola]
MRYVFFSLLVPAGLALAAPARAQARFSMGPQVGAVGSFTSYYGYGNYTGTGRPYQTRYLAGFEAGVVGALNLGHVQVQPALLFAQRGFRIADDYITYYFHATTSVRQRLNYLSLPLNLAYTFRATGQGLQVFGGPYVSLLLGGTYVYHNTYVGYRQPEYTIDGTLPVAGSQQYGSSSNDPAEPNPPLTTYYARRLDAGFQVGLGYRFGNGLVRAGYSLGLTNPGVGSEVDHGQNGVYTTKPSSYPNQAFQLSLAYLFSLPSGS